MELITFSNNIITEKMRPKSKIKIKNKDFFYFTFKVKRMFYKQCFIEDTFKRHMS